MTAGQSSTRAVLAASSGTIVQAFRECTDATVITVLMEDGLALIGLLVAGVGIGLAKTTGWYALDGYASVPGARCYIEAESLKTSLHAPALPSSEVPRE
jgi:hypothetical protein